MRKVKRQLPSYTDLRKIIRFRKRIWNRRERRLSNALTIYDLRTIAKKLTPRGPFDYADGAADSEESLNRARRAFENVEFSPRVLRDVSNVDITRMTLGKMSGLPVGLAPTGFTRMLQTEGEIAGCTAAAARNIPFALSIMGTTSIENIAQATPNGRNWFQLYMWKDRERSMALVERARSAGFDTLILTVDVPVTGARLRDVRNGLTIPPSLTLGTILDALPRPGWWLNLLTTAPLEFASLGTWNGTVAELSNSLFDSSVTFEDLKWIREQWTGGLVVKGIQNIDDARAAVNAGADAVCLSNHGGRQLDRAPVPLRLLPEVVREIGGDAEVHIDSGIMHGSDIISAIALGAQFTWIGRAYLYGLMAGGRKGVDRTLAILTDEMIRTMQLLGVASLDELEPSHVSFLRDSQR